MFGFGFKGKVKRILGENFNYRPNAIQAPVLSGIVTQAKSMGVNEYDAAIMFMASMMNSLQGDDERIDGFIKSHTRNIEKIMHLASSPASDIYQMLDLIKSNHEPQEENSKSHYSTFNDWLMVFKVKCGEINPGLRVKENGGSLIDFMDHEPLKKAYRENVSPEIVANGFASTFDPATFGK